MPIRPKTDVVKDFVDDVPFNLTARRISDAERTRYQVFISHSNADGGEMVKTVAAALKNNGINVAFDREFMTGGDNFRRLIENNIHCYAGIVLITPRLLQSEWCSFEIGYFAGQELEVFLYDPDRLLEAENNGTENRKMNYHLHRYLPAYHSLDELVVAVSTASIYNGMFKHETATFTKKNFSDAMAAFVDTSVVRVSSGFFEKDPEAFKDCVFGTLVINFGTFHTTVKREAPCFAVKGKSDCVTKENKICAVLPIETVTEDNMECVLLNHVLRNGTFVTDEGQPYLEFHLPVHRKYGTEFKFIVDAPDNDKLYRLLNLFEMAGMNPSLSDSFNGGRIFLALPDRCSQGIFNIRGDYNNNFACPKALTDVEN